MSASNKKKLQKEQNTARMTERQRKEAEEQKKLRRYTATFWIVMALCVCIVLSTVLTNPIKNVIYQSTTAVTIGEHKLSSVEVNYFYIDAINQFCNDYGYYLSMLMDTSKPLNQQVYDKTTGATWADNFLSSAIENIKSTYALYDLAVANGMKLSDEDQASIDTMMSNLKIYATYYGYSNANAYLRSVYGNGANEKSYRAYCEVCQLAAAYYDAYSESLDYDDAALRAFEADKFEQYSSYTYAFYYFKADTFLQGGTKSEDGKTTTYSDEEKAAAVAIAKKLADELAAGNYEDLDAFDKAINELVTKQLAANKEDTKDENTTEGDSKTVVNSENETTGNENTGDENTGDENTGDENTGDENTGNENTGDENTGDENTGDENTGDEDEKEDDEKKDPLKYTSTKKEDVLYSSVNSLFIDWLIGKETSDEESEEGDESEDKEEEEETLVVRQIGDLTVIVDQTTSGETTTVKGYYVVRFGGVNDNTYKLKNVRHILVAFEGGTYNSTTGQTTYSEAEKKAAKAEAEKLLEEFKATAMTEDIFAEMATKHTADEGSKENGGLYEDVYPGQMVTNFNDWCFDEERKVGDFGLVESNYGWHIMYYSGESETSYRDYMLENDLRTEELTEWMEGLVKAANLVEKNLKYVNRELVLSTT